MGVGAPLSNARGQSWTRRPRSTSADASVGPSDARAIPTRSVRAACAVGSCGRTVGICGGNDGDGVTMPGDAGASTGDGDAVGRGAVVGDGDADDAVVPRRVSESSWKKTM